MAEGSLDLDLSRWRVAGIGGEITLRAWHALRATGPIFVALDRPGTRVPAARRDAPDQLVATVNLTNADVTDNTASANGGGAWSDLGIQVDEVTEMLAIPG